jgi:hypothetical protein
MIIFEGGSQWVKFLNGSHSKTSSPIEKILSPFDLACKNLAWE